MQAKTLTSTGSGTITKESRFAMLNATIFCTEDRKSRVSNKNPSHKYLIPLMWKLEIGEIETKRRFEDKTIT